MIKRSHSRSDSSEEEVDIDDHEKISKCNHSKFNKTWDHVEFGLQGIENVEDKDHVLVYITLTSISDRSNGTMFIKEMQVHQSIAPIIMSGQPIHGSEGKGEEATSRLLRTMKPRQVQKVESNLYGDSNKRVMSTIDEEHSQHASVKSKAKVTSKFLLEIEKASVRKRHGQAVTQRKY